MQRKMKNKASKYMNSLINWQFLVHADGSLKNEFRLMLKVIALFFPTDMFFSDYGSKPESFSDNTISDEELEERALLHMKKNNHDFTIENYISKYTNSEPFAQYSKSWEHFVEKNYAEL